MRGKIIKIISALSITTLLTGCIAEKNTFYSNDVNSDDSNEIIELNFWSYFGGVEDLISEFEKENPNIKINHKEFSYEEYEEAYKESLMKEDGEADIFVIDSNEYGSFNSIEGLEDLSKPEYSANEYKDDFDKELWELGKSLDKTELLGLPFASAPIVTYYRKDILEDYGFPGEPEELAEFMKDKNNWFNMAQTLKKDGIYLLQWYSELTKIASANMPYFNEKLEYQRNNEEFKNAISLAIDARNLGIAAFDDIWSESGKKLLKDGKLAMLYLGTWGSSEIESIVPEQKGQWRATTLPFGVYGWNNASIVSMAANSKNKEAAWKFIEYYVFKYKDKSAIGSVPAYIPLRESDNISYKNDFLGGQDEHKIYYDSMNKTNEYPVTPLDADALKIWDNAVNEGLEEELSADEILKNINKNIESNFKDTIKLLKSQLDIN